MTADERLALIQVKIERAKKHILDLGNAITAFNESKPYAVRTKRDPQTRNLIYYVSHIAPIPTCVAAITGDVLQNLRSALDHLHQHLWMVGTGNAAPGKGKEFTFYIGGDPNPAQYKTSAAAKLQGLRQDAVDALLRVEPCKGGNGHQFWVLNELSNIDKHRLLVTVATTFRNLNLWPVIARKIAGSGHPMLHGFDIEQAKFTVVVEPATRSPLKIGDEIFIDAADAEPNERMEFRFDVALDEPGVLECQPLMQTVHQLADLVSDTVLSFRPCL